jgi:hypothetical protein
VRRVCIYIYGKHGKIPTNEKEKYGYIHTYKQTERKKQRRTSYILTVMELLEEDQLQQVEIN